MSAVPSLRPVPTAGPVPVPRQAARSDGSILAALGVAGMDHLEPVFVAALVTEKPLLLIGLHGTGKSWLLVRLAEALGLSFRHYNASLLGFDDLVGFPLPDGNGGLRYVPTPASVWGAEAVFLDEISRARPEVQNKLFSILHEKKVQGLPIESLRYRWSAMNPPGSRDGQDDEYVGSEPLDLALADRFAFVVEVPAWASLSPADKQSVLLESDAPITDETRELVTNRLEAARALLPSVHEESRERVATYVEALLDLLPGIGIHLSARRAVTLLENILAVQAASLAVDDRARLKESAFLAIAWSLPQPASGTAVDRPKLLALHQEAWGDREAKVLRHGFQPTIAERVRSIFELAGRGDVSPVELSVHVADAFASLPHAGRHALAFALVERRVVERLTAPVAEQWAGLYAPIASAHRVSGTIRFDRSPNVPRSAIGKVEAYCALKPDAPRDRRCLANLLAYFLEANGLTDAVAVEIAVSAWDEVVRAAGVGGKD